MNGGGPPVAVQAEPWAARASAGENRSSGRGDGGGISREGAVSPMRPA